MRRLYCVFTFVILVTFPALARASVSLVFADLDGTNNLSVNVLPNATFTVRLNCVTTNSTTDDHTGIDYFLTMLGGGSGLFRIQDRNTSGSLYNDLNADDATVEALPSALLDPQNDDDLGGGPLNTPTENQGTYAAGTFLVAVYTIKVDAAAPKATYSLQTTSLSGTGWVGRHDATPDPYPENEFAQHANYSIVVVPEPASGATALTACGIGLTLSGRRGRRARSA